jgi:hypothetical protein
LWICFWIITINPTVVTSYGPRKKNGSSLAFLAAQGVGLRSLLLIICQELENELHGNATHVRIFSWYLLDTQ